MIQPLFQNNPVDTVSGASPFKPESRPEPCKTWVFGILHGVGIVYALMACAMKKKFVGFRLDEDLYEFVSRFAQGKRMTVTQSLPPIYRGAGGLDSGFL